jgi:hypothetical protein
MDRDGKSPALPADPQHSRSPGDEEYINTSGHCQELDRTWGFWSIAGQAIISNNAWAAGAGSLVLACVTVIAAI